MSNEDEKNEMMEGEKMETKVSVDYGSEKKGEKIVRRYVPKGRKIKKCR